MTERIQALKHFQWERMHHAARILAVDNLVIFGVELLQLLHQCLEAFLGEAAFERFARNVIHRGDIVDAIAHSIDIHHAAAGHEGEIVRAELARENLQYLLFKERCAIVVSERERAHEVMGYQL